MTGTPIAACLGGELMALAYEHAQSHMHMSWPDGEPQKAQLVTDQIAGIDIPRGERYGIARHVALMPVKGLLTPDTAAFEKWFGWATYQGITRACAELAANDDVSAAVLDINSPGGMVLGLEGAAEAIAELAAVKPVHIVVNPLAASAAYFLASQGTDITLVKGAQVGSIGITRLSVWPVQSGQDGNQWGVHVSSHARAKRPDPTDEAGLAEIQRGLDESENTFLNAVAKGRDLDRATLPSQLSITDDERDGGAMYEAQEAVSRGLADSVETYADFYGRIFGQYAPPVKPRQSRAMSVAARARIAKAKSRT